MTDPIRFLDRIKAGAFNSRRRQASKCEACGESTSEGKPWCSSCVYTKSPYVVAVRRESRRRAREIARVEARGRAAVHASSPIAQEVLGAIVARGGSATVARVAKDTNMAVSVVLSYVERLEGRGLLSTRAMGRRGRIMCVLTDGDAG